MGVEVAIGSAAAISKVAKSNGYYCTSFLLYKFQDQHFVRTPQLVQIQ